MIRILKSITHFPLRQLIPALLVTGFLISMIALLLLYRLDYRASLESAREKEADISAQLLHDLLENSGTDPQTAHLMDQLSRNGATIMVADSSGTIIQSTGNAMTGKTLRSALRPYRFARNDLLEAVFEPETPLSRPFFLHQGEQLLHILPLQQNGKTGAIVVILDSTDTLARLDRKLYILVLPALAVIGLPLLFFMFLYERFYKTRLTILMETTRALKRGELDVRAEMFGRDEIAELGRLFNSMASRIGTLAYRDSLTGIRNRASFESAVGFQLKGKQPAAMVFMDLDGFKFVNETFGHNVGDRMLQLVAERISSLVPDDGVFARIGGDEFALFLREYRDITSLQLICERIIHYVSQDFDIEGIHHHIGISMGIALYPEDGATFHEILMNADLAMYQAKHAGKNTFMMFNDAIRDQMRRKTMLMNQLNHTFRKSLLREQFFPVYQPIINVETGNLDHVESLMRWTGQDGLHATTAEIVPLLEESGLVRELGFFVFERVTQDFRQVLDALAPDMPLPGITVNVSVIQLLDPAFVRRVADIVWKNGLHPDHIIIEITESELMKQPEKVIRSLNTLHDRGFRFAIDDFGTGYSSLSYLKHLPVSYLKIDRSFIKDVSFNEKSQLIARSIIVLGKALGLKVVAEGVEDLDTARMIARLGTDYLQGYFCSRPLPFSEVKDLIQKRFRFYDPGPGFQRTDVAAREPIGDAESGD